MKSSSTNVAVIALAVVFSACAPVQPTVRQDDQASSQPKALEVASSWIRPASDTRVVLTNEGINDIRQRLIDEQAKPANGEFLNIDAAVEKEFHLTQQRPPNTTATVAVPSWNVAAVGLPYNPEWVSDLFSLPPYYVGENNISFGPLVYDWHGMQFFRTMWMEPREHRTATEAMDAAKSDPFLREGTKPELHLVGDREAVMFVIEQPESAPITMLEVVTPQRNYMLTCWADGFGYKSAPAQSCARLLDIAGSLRLQDETGQTQKDVKGLFHSSSR